MDYFQNLNIRDLSGNKKFQKTIKSYFSNKGPNNTNKWHKNIFPWFECSPCSPEQKFYLTDEILIE